MDKKKYRFADGEKRNDKKSREPLLNNDDHNQIYHTSSINNIQDSDDDWSRRSVSCGTHFQQIWVLLLTSLMTFLQGGIWNTWGPIAPSIQSTFGWPDSEIALLANWGPICYFAAVLPSSFLMYKGVRKAMLVAMLLVAAGSGIRLIPAHSTEQFSYFVHAGQILNGIAGPIAMSIPPVVSATYFPVHRRTLATSIMTVFNNLGLAISFIAGPMIVTNSTNCMHKTRVYMWGQTICSLVVLGCVIMYYPDKPSNAPSRSSLVDRTPFWVGFRRLFRDRAFWCCAFSYGYVNPSLSVLCIF